MNYSSVCDLSSSTQCVYILYIQCVLSYPEQNESECVCFFDFLFVIYLTTLSVTDNNPFLLFIRTAFQCKFRFLEQLTLLFRLLLVECASNLFVIYLIKLSITQIIFC